MSHCPRAVPAPRDTVEASLRGRTLQTSAEGLLRPWAASRGPGFQRTRPPVIMGGLQITRHSEDQASRGLGFQRTRPPVTMGNLQITRHSEDQASR